MCTHTYTCLHGSVYFEFMTLLFLVSDIFPIFRTYFNFKNEVFISIYSTSYAIPVSCGLPVTSLSKSLDSEEVDEEMEDT